MALVNRRKISLYDEAKAGFSSLVQQTAQVGLGLLVILLLTGGNPPGFIVALSFFGGIGFIAWREKQRLSQSEQLLKEQQEFSHSVVVEKQQFTQSEQSLEEKQNLKYTLLEAEIQSSADISINNYEEIIYNKNTAIVTESSEKVLYNKNEVRITRTLLEYKGTEYPIRNISKVKLEKKKVDYYKPLIGFIIVGCLAGILGYTFLRLFIFFITWVWVGVSINRIEVKPTYKLIITTNQGEVITLEPKDSEDMKQMRDALEQAIDMSDYR